MGACLMGFLRFRFMTYCVAISVKAGIVFCSDSRTDAGVDQISTYSKMHRFGRDGERQLIILTAGNLATTRAVINQIKNDIQANAFTNLLKSPSSWPSRSKGRRDNTFYATVSQ